MINKKNLLVFPSESENSFEIFNALRFSTRFCIWGASSAEGHGQHVFENYYSKLPKINENNFIFEFNKFLEDKNISFIIATHDDIAVFLSLHQNEIKAQLIGSKHSTADICRHKKKLFSLLKNEDFCPTVFDNKSLVTEFPVFIKPDASQGSRDCHIVNSQKDFDNIKIKNNETVICEYLPGQEITVDCFTDFDGEIQFIGPRTREKIKLGIAFQSTPLPVTEEISEIGKKLNELIKPRGIWFFQLKKDIKDKYKILEASCRPSTGMGIYRHIGVNLPLMAAYDALGIKTTALKNKDFSIHTSKSLKNSYKHDLFYTHIYIDYDDTIIVNNQPNLSAIHFLYQSKLENKKIIILSRHDKDIYQSMKKNCICPDLFDEIIILEEHQKKSSFIQSQESIFIDNLFHERMEVLKNSDIPVFDVDAIDLLIKGQ